MIPLEELFARLESSAEEVVPHGLIPRPQKQKRSGNETIVEHMIPLEELFARLY